MQTIRLEVEDSKLETVLNIIQNLKETLITRYEISSDVQISKNEAATRITQAVKEVRANKATLFSQEEYDHDMNEWIDK